MVSVSSVRRASASGEASASGSASGSSIPYPISSFNTYLPMITSALDRLTTSANALPSTRSDINFNRTMDRKFANDLDEASDRVLKMAEQLLIMVEVGQEESKGKGKGKEEVAKTARTGAKASTKTRRRLEDEDDVVDGYKRGVVGVVDGLLEDADSCLDELSGQKKKAAIKIPAAKIAAAGQKLPGPFNSSSNSALGRLPMSILHANDLAKPQLLFQDTVDNTNHSTPWRPNLVTKQHAMVPLDFDVPLEYELTPDEKVDPSAAQNRRAREAKLARHPYYYETRHLPYPTSMFTIADAIEPKSFEDTPFTFVDTPEALEEMVEKLRQAKEIAVDLEHHNMRSYYGITCLIQISTRDQDWIVDPLALRAELREDKLGGVMADPSIVKVFHGSESDMVWLQRDFDIYVVNLFDTFHATKVLGFAQHSLAYLLSHYCQYQADKRYQMADWRMRPLPKEMLDYARSDTHYLLYIYDRLRNSLLEQSSRPPSPVDGQPEVAGSLQRRNPQEAMREVLDRSGETALKLYERDVYDAATGKGPGGWANQSRKFLTKAELEEEVVGAVFKAVHTWRDEVARKEDESPAFIMPGQVLKLVANWNFSSADDLARCNLVHRAPVIKHRAKELYEVLQKAREDFQTARLAKRSAPAQSEASQTNPAADPQGGESVAPAATNSTPVPSMEDVWGDVVAKPAAKSSSLFGSTIGSGSSSKGPRPAVKGKSSGLFGKTISSSASRKTKAYLFDDVKQSIFDDLLPPIVSRPTAVVPEQEPSTVPQSKVDSSSSTWVVNGSKAQPIEIDHSSSSRSSIPTEMPDVHEPSPPKRMKRDEIVQVKKRSRKPKDTITSSSSIATPSSDNANVGTSMEIKKEKSSKKRAAGAEIPEFDYTKAPNLLDNPKSGIKDAGKKKRKEKKERKELTGADFGPAPKEKSNMRSGNKSGTF